MNFLTPIGFAFGAALPVVVVFYLLKRKRVVRVVPSTLLWQRFLAENQANSPFQRLRNHWLLWLQLLLLALAVLALGRPYFRGTAGTSSLQVIILDASASMQATDESPSRFGQAQAEALKLVDGLRTASGSDRQQMLVLVAGATTEVRQSATSDRAALRRAIQSARASDASTRLGDALRVAESLTRDNPGSEIHLFTDGSGVDLKEFEHHDLPLLFHKLGRRSENAGMVSLDVKASPEDPSQRAIFTSVVNNGSAPLASTVELRFDGQLIETKPVTVPVGGITPLVFFAQQGQDGVFSVTLTQPDDLMADNQARSISLLPRPIRVGLVSRGNRFLEKAIAAAAPQVEVRLLSDYRAGDGHFDLVVLDDITPTVWPTDNLFAIHVVASNWFEGPPAVIENPAIVDWRNTHPLLRFVGFDTVQIAQSLAVKPLGWALPLVDSPQAPLILAGELGRQRAVWLGFDLLQSTWPLRLGFPIFVANAVQWLNPATAAANRAFLHPGDPIRLPLGQFNEPAGGQVTAGVAELVLPDGHKVSVPVDAKAREIVYGGTDQQGIYRLTWGTNRTDFAVNLLDPVESNLKPGDNLSVGRRGTILPASLKRANLESWRWFALGALAVLTLEWWWFHRRTA